MIFIFLKKTRRAPSESRSDTDVERMEVGVGGGEWRWGMEVRVVCTLVFGFLFFDNALQSLQVSEALE